MTSSNQQPPLARTRDLFAQARITSSRARRDQVVRYLRYVRTLAPVSALVAYAIAVLLLDADPSQRLLAWLVVTYLAGLAYEALASAVAIPRELLLRASLVVDTILVAGVASSLPEPSAVLAAFLWPVLAASYFLLPRDVVVVASIAGACSYAVATTWTGPAILVPLGGFLAFVTSQARLTERELERERLLEEVVLRFTDLAHGGESLDAAIGSLELDLRRAFAVTHAWVDLATDDRDRRAVPGGITIPVRWNDSVVARIKLARAGGAELDPRIAPQVARVATFVSAVLGQHDATAREVAARERLRDADRLKDRFLAMASHELRTPLTSIRGFSETIARQWDILADEDKLRFLAIVVAQSDRLARLVDDLLLLSGIQSGRFQLRPVPVRVEHAVDRCLRELGVEGVHVDCDPHVRAFADPDHLAQMLQHYVSNALRYGDGPISVACTAATDGVTISVADQGAGVHESFRPRLFSEFQRANGSIGEHGTGLGLSIVRTLARAYGGDAWHEPNEPTGSRFHVRLPSCRD